MKVAESPVSVLPVLGLMMLAGAGGPCTTSVTGTDAVVAPLTPTMLTAYVPGAQFDVPRTRFPAPGAVTNGKVGATQAGSTDVLNVTCPVKPFTEATLIAKVAFTPGDDTLCVIGEAVRVNVPVENTWTFTVLSCQILPPP
ncbi:MAG: hypothetical protein ABSC05_37200, partial [Candidatus Solibacter sp.]